MKKVIDSLFGILLFFVIGNALAYGACTEHCSMSKIGIGGAYYDFGGEEIKSAGAYLTGEYRSLYIPRVQAVFGTRLGGGQTKASSVLGVAEKSSFVMLDYYVKLGLNIASTNVPLYVNIFAERNNHDGDSFRGKGLRRDLTLLGAEIEGAIPLASTQLEYLVGYAWSVNGQYALDGKVADMQRGNYVINAGLGFARNLNEKYAYYVRFIGKIEDLKAAHFQDGLVGYPHSKNLVGMVEVGLKSF